MSASRVSGWYTIVSVCFAICLAGWGRSNDPVPGGRSRIAAGTKNERTGRPPGPIAEHGTPADTLLADSIRAGRVLIRRLPERVSGRPVEAYVPVVVPATGWLHDGSFFWRVPVDLDGAFRFVFAATRRSAAPDTVVVQVQVLPE